MSPSNSLPSPLTQRQHDEQLWFEDGNIVVQAGTRLFRVFRGILCARCTVFDDMFSLPQPMDEGDMYEGYSIVYLYDDLVEVRWFLLAIFGNQRAWPEPWWQEERMNDSTRRDLRQITSPSASKLEIAVVDTFYMFVVEFPEPLE